jgi:flagellar hook assembly protein FlgD
MLAGTARVSGTIGLPIIMQVQAGSARVDQGFWYFNRDSALSSVANKRAVGQTMTTSYPNPFRTTATITYTLDKSLHVRLAIHDLLGRTMKVLTDGWQQQGEKRIEWDGTDAAGKQVESGTYLYVLEVNGEASISTSRAVLLVR